MILCYEVIFNPENIDQECDRTSGLMSNEGKFIKNSAGCRAVKAGCDDEGLRLSESSVSLLIHF